MGLNERSISSKRAWTFHLKGVVVALLNLIAMSVSANPAQILASLTPQDQIRGGIGPPKSRPDDHNAEKSDRQQDSYDICALHNLKVSSNPRDWSVAASLCLSNDWTSECSPEELKQRALADSRNDAIVQWVTLANARASLKSTDTLEVLNRLEPDNAAVWLEVVTHATQAHDAKTVDMALRHAAKSTRFNAHYSDVMNVTLAAYQRCSIPSSFLVGLTKSYPALSQDVIPFVWTFASTNAFPWPAFQHTLNACRVNPATGENARRARDCQKVGRLLVSKGDTLIANRIGFALLRVSHTNTKSDIGNSRQFDWQIWANNPCMSKLENENEVKLFVSQMRDWIKTGSEIESCRRAVTRRGNSLEPPADWADNWSPFSEERQRADDAALTKAVPAH